MKGRDVLPCELWFLMMEKRISRKTLYKSVSIHKILIDTMFFPTHPQTIIILKESTLFQYVKELTKMGMIWGKVDVI